MLQKVVDQDLKHSTQQVKKGYRCGVFAGNLEWSSFSVVGVVVERASNHQRSVWLFDEASDSGDWFFLGAVEDVGRLKREVAYRHAGASLR